jgi:hypothetical protein
MGDRRSARLLPELSNFYCHPGRAGGSPFVISEDDQRTRMARPGLLAHRLQCFPKEPLRFAVAALMQTEYGQIVEAHHRVRMARPEHLAPRLQCFPNEPLRLDMTALMFIETGQTAEAF